MSKITIVVALFCVINRLVSSAEIPTTINTTHPRMDDDKTTDAPLSKSQNAVQTTATTETSAENSAKGVNSAPTSVPNAVPPATKENKPTVASTPSSGESSADASKSTQQEKGGSAQIIMESGLLLTSVLLMTRF